MQILIWALYFAADVYGHLALKLASREPTLWRIALSPWGITAGLAWIIAGVMWMLILSKHSLLAANTISALSYALIAFAAIMFFQEDLTVAKLLGTGLICAGIYLMGR